MIFVDTSAFFALANVQDLFHQQATRILQSFLENKESLLTHNYILVEAYALMHRRLGLPVARQFYRDVYRLCHIHWITQSQHERASKKYVEQPGSGYSFVDFTSFEIMKVLGVKKAFAFDSDFSKAGFETLF